MNEGLRSFRPWLNFAGCVLVVAVLYWTKAILIPFALAVLLAFLLTPLVALLQRRIGRVPAVLVAVALIFAGLGLSGWGLAAQLSDLIADLPGYRANIREKIADIRRAGQGTSVETVQETLAEIQTQITASDAQSGASSEPFVVWSERSANSWAFSSLLGPVLGPLTTAGLVIVLVIFMLLERDTLRSRLIGLIGHGHLAVTTKALDEAGRRVSRQLLTQTAVNALYGVGVGIGLNAIGVPYAFLWAVLSALLRFIPYVGPFMGAAGPILVGLAALPGWGQPLWVMALFLGLELFTNLVLETVLFAGAAGLSSLALLVALTFWTWLWGPIGLLMATPLTICVVVLGRHVPGMEFLSILMTDAPTLPPDMHFYQRLLAHDPSEASADIDRHIKQSAPETSYDALLLPALNYAKRDRLENRLSDEDERELIDSLQELMSDALGSIQGARADDSRGESERTSAAAASGPERTTVLAWPTSSKSDALALRMLGQLLERTPVALEILSEHRLSSEIIALVAQRGCPIVCIADLPPSPPSRTRYLIKKLRSALPQLTIVVGRWAPPSLADDRVDQLIEAGANSVGSTLVETREELCRLARHASGRTDPA